MQFTGTFEIVQYPILTTVMVVAMIFTSCFLFGWIQLAINGMLNKVDHSSKKKKVEDYSTPQYYSSPDPAELIRQLTGGFQRKEEFQQGGVFQQVGELPQRCPFCGREQPFRGNICVYCGCDMIL